MRETCRRPLHLLHVDEMSSVTSTFPHKRVAALYLFSQFLQPSFQVTTTVFSLSRKNLFLAHVPVDRHQQISFVPVPPSALEEENSFSC